MSGGIEMPPRTIRSPRKNKNREKLVAPRSRRERACKRTGEASVTFRGRGGAAERVKRRFQMRSMKKAPQAIRSLRRRGRGDGICNHRVADTWRKGNCRHDALAKLRFARRSCASIILFRHLCSSCGKAVASIRFKAL